MSQRPTKKQKQTAAASEAGPVLESDSMPSSTPTTPTDGARAAATAAAAAAPAAAAPSGADVKRDARRKRGRDVNEDHGATSTTSDAPIAPDGDGDVAPTVTDTKADEDADADADVASITNGLQNDDEDRDGAGDRLSPRTSPVDWRSYQPSSPSYQPVSPSYDDPDALYDPASNEMPAAREAVRRVRADRNSKQTHDDSKSNTLSALACHRSRTHCLCTRMRTRMRTDRRGTTTTWTGTGTLVTTVGAAMVRSCPIARIAARPCVAIIATRAKPRTFAKVTLPKRRAFRLTPPSQRPPNLSVYAVEHVSICIAIVFGLDIAL